MNQLLYTLGVFSLLCCSPNEPSRLKGKFNIVEKESKERIENDFNDYWYSGKAELNSYELKQSKYGEIRKGSVVLVFVTEPFSLSKQVKLDTPKKAGKDNVPVMKLNKIKKFTTGIYDYSIVSSVFTPVDISTYPNSLKLNTSIQEWCGHTFTQLNLKNNNYKFQELSYFESVGDTKRDIPVALLEEELMTRIRLNRGELPLGELDMIFSITYGRFVHKELKATKAKISKKESEKTISYTIDYLSYDREITINIQKEFPYKIISWKEDNGDGLITEARLKKSIREPYWSQKKVSDEGKRKELQLLN